MSHMPAYQFKQFLAPRYYLTWFCLAWAYLIAHCPFAMQQAVGRFLGRSTYYLMPKRRHITLTNLRLCFPDKSDADIQKIAKQSFAEVGLGAIEAAVTILGNPEKLASRVTVDGMEYVNEALAQKRGVIILGAHFASLELAGYLAAKMLPMHATYRPLKNKLIDYLVYKQRKAHFHGVIHRSDIRGMISALKRGDAIWYAPDQDYGRHHSVFVPFFGIQTATVTGLSRLASMSGAVVLPGFQIREKNGYRFIALPALTDFPSGDYEKDAVQINTILERIISEYPEQYLWQHRRFKTRPVGESGVY
jgi:Kdo2-lipid IVA lauroyltransferase/acyltransferase